MMIDNWPVTLVLVTTSIFVQARADKHAGVPFDPVKKNAEQIFEEPELGIIADPRDSESGPKELSEPWKTHGQPPSRDPRFSGAEKQRPERRSKRNPATTEISFNDPLWPIIKYLHHSDGFSLNIDGAWRESVSGKGVVVAIISTGVEKDHADLSKNYNAEASYDFVEDHSGRISFDLEDGTRAAGLVAAEANNDRCTIGVAHGASFGDVRVYPIIDNDKKVADALNLASEKVDIYLPLWSVNSLSSATEGPGKLATRALEKGVKEGRGGKGSLFIFESRQGSPTDDCVVNGWTNSIWTISISGASTTGGIVAYLPDCPSTFATTIAPKSSADTSIITTAPSGRCVGDSETRYAGSALATGIIALALEANPKLTWRDVEHIIVRTARLERLRETDSLTNGVGRNVSYWFGFGVMDAGAMVKLARKWKTVPELLECKVQATMEEAAVLEPNVTFEKSLYVDECNGIRYMEKVQVVVTLSAPKRGDVEIILVSPMRTATTLLRHRSSDDSAGGFVEWPFMSVHNWGEDVAGWWKLNVLYKGDGRAVLEKWSMVVHGTSERVKDDGGP